MIDKLYSATITPVFYEQRFDDTNPGAEDLSLKKICNEIDWGSASDLIKHEGFYMFGGRNPENEAVDTLLIIKPSIDKHYIDRAKLKIIKPKTFGEGPCPRYMHTSNFMPKLGLFIIYGGRNDFLPKMQILNDMFVLKLHTLEWTKV